jgi:hypothetical protein
MALRCVKKGDPIVMYGYDSTITSGLATADVSPREMRDPNAILALKGSGDWHINPRDLFYLPRLPETEGEHILEASPAVERAFKRKGYAWYIQLVVKRPPTLTAEASVERVRPPRRIAASKAKK